MDWQKIVIHHTASPTEVRRSGKIIPVDVAINHGASGLARAN